MLKSIFAAERHSKIVRRAVKAGLLKTLAMAGCLLPLVTQAEEAAPPTKEAVVKALQGWNSGYRNLRIKGSAVVRGYDATTKEFPVELGSARYVELVDLGDSGRFRIAFDSVVTPWTNGEAPFFEMQKTIAYDGGSYTEAIYRQGPPKDLYEYHRVTIKGSVPKDVSVYQSYLPNDVLTGFAKMFGEKSIAEMMKDPVIKRGAGREMFTTEIRAEKQDGLDMIRIEIKNACNSETLYLAPTEGWRLAKRIRAFGLCGGGGAKGRWEWLAKDAKEAAPGLWVPGKVELTRYQGDVPEQMVSVEIYDATAGKEETPDMYSVPFAAGATVTDERSGTTFEAGGR